MSDRLKKHETIGCCGIDCGLCPRYYTKGYSTCPGCGGMNFREKHPSCGFLTCCVLKRGHEVCSDCNDYPCNRFDAEKEGYDSFVTHRKVVENLGFIQNNGIEQYLKIQSKRLEVLKNLLTHLDDGRSKSLFCIVCALLPLEQLEETQVFTNNIDPKSDLREKCRLVKAFLNNMAVSLNIELKLHHKK